MVYPSYRILERGENKLFLKIIHLDARNIDNPNGLWIVAVLHREDTPDGFELTESWSVANGLQEASATYAQHQQHPNYFAGGIYACVASDIYPTLHDVNGSPLDMEGVN